jgi:hypothetical protein
MPPSLTGRWAGHYTQHGQSHPIVTLFRQDGDRLSGSMQDVQNDGECSVFELAAESGLPPGADEQIEAKVREAVPDAPRGPVRYVWHLPSDSVLDGRCAGRKVSFLKTYQGKSVGGFRLGDHLVGAETEGHSVHYEGELSPDGTLIEGRWWIEADPSRGTGAARGSFALRRWGEGEARDEG